MLWATFVRIRESADRVEVMRSDGSRSSWTFPSYRGSLPHDLVHLVVESAFELRRAFWSAVDAGGEPEHIHAAAQRSRRLGEADSFAEQREELLAAEGLAAIHWYDPFVDGRARCADLEESCALFGVRPPKAVTPERATAAHELLRKLRAAWREAGTGAPMTLPFVPSDPFQSFTEIMQRFGSAR